VTRKSRELGLVLVGAGILTAGYFIYSDNKELMAKEEEQTKHQVGGRHGYHSTLIFIHGGGYSGGRSSSPAMASNTSRGGFGRIGSFSAGG
jgi:hypothetical protein